MRKPCICCWRPVPTETWRHRSDASIKNSRIEVVRLLLDAGADRNKANGAGTTALMMASDPGHSEVVCLLLEAGAEKNLADSYGCAALMWA